MSNRNLETEKYKLEDEINSVIYEARLGEMREQVAKRDEGV